MRGKKSQSPPQDYSVNALSRLTGRDRRTIDKAVVGVAPARTENGKRFYRLEDVEAALRAKPGASLREEKLSEEIRKLRIANDRAEGKSVLKTAVVECFSKVLPKVKELLEQRIVNEYPTAVAGLDVPQARIYGKRLNDELLTQFQALGVEFDAL